MKKETENRRNIAKEDFLDCEKPGFVFLKQDVTDTAFHRHDFHELVIVTDGSGYHVTPKGRFRVARGDVFLSPPGILHGTLECSRLKTVIFLFYPELTGFSFAPLREMREFQIFFKTAPHLTDTFRFRNKFHLEPDALLHVNVQIRQIEREWTLRHAGWGFELNSLFMQLLLFLLRSVFRNHSEGYRDMLLLNEILQYIATCGTKTPYPSEIADKFSVTQRSLERLFRKTLDTTPIRYLMEQRLFRSQELLKETSLSVSEVGLRTGFADSAYFSKCFSSRFGLSPRAYRKKEHGSGKC